MLDSTAGYICPICCQVRLSTQERDNCLSSHKKGDYLSIESLLGYAKATTLKKTEPKYWPRYTKRNQARKEVLRRIENIPLDYPLIPGQYYYNRLTISDKWLLYDPSRDKPVEIYYAIINYLQRTRKYYGNN